MSHTTSFAPLFGEALGDDAAEPLRGTGHDSDAPVIAPASGRLGERQSPQRLARMLLAHLLSAPMRSSGAGQLALPDHLRTGFSNASKRNLPAWIA
jgi:hypothetical protein